MSKVLFWSSDEQIAGKNILSAVKNGQIIKAKDLQILNNVFPNLSLYAAEWNRNIEECQKALKAFEVATGETIEASASATAVAIQNERVGLYYNYKREKYSLWKTAVFRRWVIPELLKSTDMEELIKLVGDPSFIEEVVDAYLNGWAVTQYMKFIALSGGIVTPEQLDMVKQMKKEQLMKRTDLFIEAIKDFFKDVEVFVTIAPTSEMFNKRGKIANGLKLMEYRANPAIMQDPDNRDRLAEIEQLLGFRPGKYRKPPEMAPARLPNANNMPQVEPSASKQALDNAQNQ